MRELTEDITGLLLSTIEDLPDVQPLPNVHPIVEKDGLTIRNRMFKTPEIRKIHIEEAEIGGIKILHCVFFPDPHYALPIFGCDIVSNGKAVTAAIVDVSPVYGVGEEFYREIRDLSNKFTFSGKRALPLWGDEIFSPHCQFLRLKDNQSQLDYHYLLTECLWSFCDRILQSESDPVWQHQMLRMDDQIYYCKQQRKNKKTIAVLSNWFDPLFARKYIDEVLFDIPTK